MSNLKVNQVTADTWLNSDGTENFKCKAWLDMTTVSGVPSVRGSGNVSSITDNGVGNYTINFVKTMPFIGYAIVGSCADADDYGDAYLTIASDISTYKTQAGCRFYVCGGGGKFDPTIATIAVFV